jgi:RNA polymerase sigma factor (sigma-70 family)
MQEIVETLEQHGLPGEHERLRHALLTDQHGMLTITRLRLARIAQARGVEASAIDDVVQETLLEAWSHLGRLSSPAGFHAWIDEICRNVCRRYARSRQAYLLRLAPLMGMHQRDEAAPGEDDDNVSQITYIPDPSTPDPLEELSRQELSMLLDHALGLLSRETRQVVEMCHLLELPHGEVAERLGISVGTLDTRLHRARRHLQQMFLGPLFQEAEALGLVEGQAGGDGWVETRLWCSSCGQNHLQGYFMETAEGVNLHVRCPGCVQRYGLDTVHSMGLVSLGRLKSFRPAWKRTMQGLSDMIFQGLNTGKPLCPWCGSVSTMHVAEAEIGKDDVPPSGPYRFWVRWWCEHCGELVCYPGDLLAVDQIVYWSHPQARQFIVQHPRWISAPGTEIEHNGQPALCFQISDATSVEKLTVLAHRHTLRVLDVY